MPGIVVGVDGSGDSQSALEWAMKEAAIKHLPLTVLTVHQVAASHWTGNPIIYPADESEVEKTRKAAEEAAQRAASQLGEAKPASVTVQAVSGLPATELINASRDADLLVVGARGGGGFARLLMGSVSSQVVHYAACPVVVVPGTRQS
ncbi:MAG TPA: universal stress protein [Streptosporangiaceae bacterium]|nr:universal stress protein [Streptosporangiaceae bacterium]